jgi:hypothetical protein
MAAIDSMRASISSSPVAKNWAGSQRLWVFDGSVRVAHNGSVLPNASQCLWRSLRSIHHGSFDRCSAGDARAGGDREPSKPPCYIHASLSQDVATSGESDPLSHCTEA